MNKRTIIRLESNGPADIDLVQEDLDPADYQSRIPIANSHSYYDDESVGLYVGVWNSTPCQETFQPYGMDEFMWLIEGQVTMLDRHNEETIVKAGEAFVIPKGFPCSWKQEEYVRKYYMIYQAPNSNLSESASFSGIIKPQTGAPLETMRTSEPFIIKGEQPVQKKHACYEDTSGQMTVGTWESTTFESESLNFPYHEMGHILEGSVTITDEKGFRHIFQKGDTFFIPKGTVCSWKSSETIRKFYSIFDPME